MPSRSEDILQGFKMYPFASKWGKHSDRSSTRYHGNGVNKDIFIYLHIIYLFTDKTECI